MNHISIVVVHIRIEAILLLEYVDSADSVYSAVELVYYVQKHLTFVRTVK